MTPQFSWDRVYDELVIRLMKGKKINKDKSENAK